MRTNWFGTLCVLQNCLPHLRQRPNARFVYLAGDFLQGLIPIAKKVLEKRLFEWTMKRSTTVYANCRYGLLPEARMLTIFLSRSNQKGAPREIASAVTIYPRILANQSYTP